MDIKYRCDEATATVQTGKGTGGQLGGRARRRGLSGPGWQVDSVEGTWCAVKILRKCRE